MRKFTISQFLALQRAAKCSPEPFPSCADCKHAYAVPDGDGGAERNVYCRLVDYSQFPKGIKMRRTAHCSHWEPDPMMVRFAKELADDADEEEDEKGA